MRGLSNGLSELIDAAFRATVAVVVERARQTGTPVIVWEDGQVRSIPGDEFEKRSEGASQEGAA